MPLSSCSCATVQAGPPTEKASFQIAASWAGYIDSTPDGVPAMGEVAGLPGFVLAAGFSGQGFGTAPASGELIADLVTGAAPAVDPAPFDPDRFEVSAWGKVAKF